jgi:AcrR family transcriptional regulator
MIEGVDESHRTRWRHMNAEPKSNRGRLTRQKLLTAGKKVFERDGFLQARVADIAAEAGVSHGSFYHYFESKESIFRVIAEAVEVRLISVDDGAHGKEKTHDPIEKVRAANRSYLLAYKKEAKIMRVIEEVSRYDDEVRKVRVERDNDLAARLESAIRSLQAQGVADTRVDGRYAAMALGGMVARFAEQMFVGGGRYDLESAIDQLTLLWCNALGLSSPLTKGAPSTNGGSGRRVRRNTAPVRASKTTA